MTGACPVCPSITNVRVSSTPCDKTIPGTTTSPAKTPTANIVHSRPKRFRISPPSPSFPNQLATLPLLPWLYFEHRNAGCGTVLGYSLNSVEQLPYTGQMMIVVFRYKIQMVYKPHGRLQTGV